MIYEGFPKGVRNIPVPSPIFGPLLEQIDTLDELKCTLRLIWLIQKKGGRNQYLTEAEIKSDRILSNSLGNHNVMKTVRAAVARGVFIYFLSKPNMTQIFTLNSEYGRKLAETSDWITVENDPEPWHSEESLPTVFTLYEQNIGIITPIIADKIKEAEDLYPSSWIPEAISESVTNNKRNWNYISTVLESWKTRGKRDGKPTRNTGKTRYR